MSSQFIAKPPLPVAQGSLKNHFLQSLRGLRSIVWQIFVPFRSQPEPIPPLPAPTSALTDAHIDQCQSIFDQANERGAHLEQKAQSTFGLMLFLAPVVASVFVFIITKATSSGTATGVVTVGLLLVSLIFLLLAFISAVRAISVKASEKLFIGSVVDDGGQFREYDRAFHARGLLHCAAMNEGMNDHLAQFVKGAQIFSAAAVVPLVVAAVLTSVALFSLPSSPTQTRIVGPVDVASPDIIALRDDIANLKQGIGTLLSSSRATEDNLKLLQTRLSKLDAKLSKTESGLGVLRPPLARPDRSIWSPP
jgi:hypothetical protein